MISAVIFDFDGVIVDSERLHWLAFSSVLEPRGKSFSWEEYVDTFIGFDDRDTFRHVFPELARPENPPRPSRCAGHPSHGGDRLNSPPPEGCTQCGEGRIDLPDLNSLIAEKAAAFQHLLETEGAPALPGAVELIKHLSGNIPIAICSGALREDILPVLASLGIADAFNAIVTADDTHISKPDPAPYRLAMERLAVAAPDGRSMTRRAAASTGVGSTLAIEDTPAGIASAKGAGLNVLAVTNSYEKGALKEADCIVASLEGLTLEELNALLA
jgi:beta-phosphoglucomutase